MRSAVLFAVLLIPGLARSQGEAPSWPLLAQRMMAADTSVYAPPDLKRQIARHRERLMTGVSEAAARENHALSTQEYQAAAKARASQIVSALRNKQSFSETVYALGVLVHSVAMSYPPPAADSRAIEAAFRNRSTFFGYPAFALPERPSVFPAAPPAGSFTSAYDSAVTAGTRLFTWIWNGVGGDVSVVLQYPESKGPYGVR